MMSPSQLFPELQEDLADVAADGGGRRPVSRGGRSVSLMGVAEKAVENGSVEWAIGGLAEERRPAGRSSAQAASSPPAAQIGGGTDADQRRRGCRPAARRRGRRSSRACGFFSSGGLFSSRGADRGRRGCRTAATRMQTLRGDAGCGMGDGSEKIRAAGVGRVRRERWMGQ